MLPGLGPPGKGAAYRGDGGSEHCVARNVRVARFGKVPRVLLGISKKPVRQALLEQVAMKIS